MDKEKEKWNKRQKLEDLLGRKLSFDEYIMINEMDDLYKSVNLYGIDMVIKLCEELRRYNNLMNPLYRISNYDLPSQYTSLLKNMKLAVDDIGLNLILNNYDELKKFKNLFNKRYKEALDNIFDLYKKKRNDDGKV